MNWDRWNKIIVMGISFIILLALPLLSDIYHKTFYFIGIIILIPISVFNIIWHEKYEQKFYNKWQKAREQGFKINVAREGVKGFALMIVTVIIGQFFGNGLTPLDIVYKLPSGFLVWLLLLLTVFGLAIGVAAWYGNEKKYYRIYEEKSTGNRK
jgi:hypothetical protein